jgi:hypothetical protein
MKLSLVGKSYRSPGIETIERSAVGHRNGVETGAVCGCEFVIKKSGI